MRASKVKAMRRAFESGLATRIKEKEGQLFKIQAARTNTIITRVKESIVKRGKVIQRVIHKKKNHTVVSGSCIVHPYKNAWRAYKKGLAGGM